MIIKMLTTHRGFKAGQTYNVSNVEALLLVRDKKAVYPKPKKKKESSS